jgi:hypothetical protein
MSSDPAIRVRPARGFRIVGTIYRESSTHETVEPTGGSIELSEHPRFGPMLLVKGLGESGRAQVRMAANQRRPFDYSDDGRRWSPLDGEDDAAFRIYGLLDPRQVLNNLASLPPGTRDSLWIDADVKVHRGESQVIGTLDLGQWYPALPSDFLAFLDDSRTQSVGIGLADGRFAELVQRDVFPRQDDTIRVVFSYRPRSLGSMLAWVAEALGRRVRGDRGVVSG